MSENIKLQLKKFIKAKRSQVFDAWTKQELIVQWFAPGSMTVPSAFADARVGGSYRVEMKGEMNGEPVNPTAAGIYKKIIPNELICFPWRCQGDPSPETIVTVELKDMSDGTEVTLTHERFASNEAKEKHQHGWIGCLDNLADFCAK